MAFRETKLNAPEIPKIKPLLKMTLKDPFCKPTVRLFKTRL